MRIGDIRGERVHCTIYSKRLRPHFCLGLLACHPSAPSNVDGAGLVMGTVVIGRLQHKEYHFRVVKFGLLSSRWSFG